MAKEKDRKAKKVLKGSNDHSHAKFSMYCNEFIFNISQNAIESLNILCTLSA